MDGSTHPEHSGVAQSPGGVRNPFAGDQPPSDAQPRPDAPVPEAAAHAQKRALEDDAADDLASDAKRIHTAHAADAADTADDAGDAEDTGDDAEDLDIDALMAQLQHHTEQAVGSRPAEAGPSAENRLAQPEPRHERQSEQPQRLEPPQPSEDSAAPETSERTGLAAHPEDNAQTEEQPQPSENSQDQDSDDQVENADQSTELSIEQQLKGALSSFQDFAFGDHDPDSHDDVDFGLSQFTEILRQNESQVQEQGEAQQGEAQQEQRQQNQRNQQEPAGSVTRQVQRVADSTLTSGLTTASDKAQAIEPETSEAVTAESEEARTDDNKTRRDTDVKQATTKEDLAARIPPLPARGGHLPPMPPPPAALTTPTAPLTAEERSQQLGRAGSAADGDKGQEPEHLAHKPRTRLPEAPPPLSERYEKSLVEQVEEAQKAADQQPRVPLLSDNQAIIQARRKSVAVLDSLAAQILEALGCNHYQETLATVTQPNSEKGLAYRLLLDAFEDAKRLFLMYASPSSRNGPESKPDEVRPFLEQNIPGLELTRENTVTIQRANLATFVAAVFGTIEVGFWELDKWFIQAFVPEGGRLLKQQATIYLDLKTQAYISAVESTTDEDARKAAIDDLFPPDLDQKLREMFGGRAMLAPSERDFVEKCERRRENIQAEDAKDLSSKYHWVPFLRELSDYVQKNHYTLLPPRQKLVGSSQVPSAQATTQEHLIHSGVSGSRSAPARRTPVPPAVSATAANAVRPMQASRRTSSPRAAAQRPPQRPTGAAEISSSVSSDVGPKSEIQEALSRANATDEQSQRPTSEGPHRPSSEEGAPNRPAQEGPQSRPQDNPPDSGGTGESQPNLAPAGHPMFPPLPKQVLPPPGVLSSDSHDRTIERARRPGPRSAADAPLVDGPTDTLAAYEAARASAEGTDALRPRASMFTTRRTWTKEEEEALMKGMDRVQGPYWAQILELYGPGGKISEVLKDRSQVQLKDKARNLKMFFVRLGLPIPAVFQYVTGDYETRKSSGKRIRERKQKAVSGPGQAMAPPAQPGQLQGPPPVTPAVNTARTAVGNGVTRSSSSADSHQLPPRHQPEELTQGTAAAALQSQQSSEPPCTSSSKASQTTQSVQPPELSQPLQPSQPTQALQPLQSSQQEPRAAVPSRTPSQQALEHSSDDGNSDKSASSKLVSGPDTDQPDILEHNDRSQENNSGKDAATQEPRDEGNQPDTSQAVSKSSDSKPSEAPEKVQTTAENEIRVEVRTEKTADFGELFSESDSKEEDLNSLLTRVGEFVDNH